ncbi:MAG: hypothetical protein OEV06_01525 [Anaerolineae bacterium]|nr:hypothetical protein [Anaerolineae bacterium]
MRRIITILSIGLFTSILSFACSSNSAETEASHTTSTTQPTDETASIPLSPSTPNPVPYPDPPQGFIPANYFANWYGTYFSYPEDWSIIDYSFQMEADAAILIRERDSGEIYLYPHSIDEFGTTDPVELLSTHLLHESTFLFHHFWMMIPIEAENLELAVVGEPIANTINEQDAASVIGQVAYELDNESISFEVMLTEIVNGTEAIVVIGYPSENIAEFSGVIQEISASIVLQPPSGPDYWQLGSSFTAHRSFHGVTPNLYAIHAPGDETLLFVATSETSCKPNIVIYDSEHVDTPAIHKPGPEENLIKPLYTASTQFRNSDVGFVLENAESRDYIVGVQSCSSYTIYYWGLSEEKSIQVHETIDIAAGEKQQWEFNSSASIGVPIIVLHDGNAELRFEIQNQDGKMLNILPLQSEKGQTIGYVFAPEIDGTFIVFVSNLDEVDSEYTIIIGSIDSQQ